MTDDASQLSDINVKPTYHASLRLRSGATTRVTEVASMLYVADRHC